MDEERGIGKDGEIPWHLKADLQRFKKLTMGHHIIMGRTTYQSIGRSLPGRIMLVLTKDRDFQASGCMVFHSLKEALAYVESYGEQEAFVIGGGQIYSQSLGYADRIYLTLVHTKANCDVFFPDYDQFAWEAEEIVFQPADQFNQFPFTYKKLVRVQR